MRLYAKTIPNRPFVNTYNTCFGTISLPEYTRCCVVLILKVENLVKLRVTLRLIGADFVS